MNPVLDAIVGGWQTNGIWRFDDGQPLLIGLSAANPGLPGYGQIPVLTGRPERDSNRADWLDWINNPNTTKGYFANPQVFQQPAAYTIGNAPRTLPWVHVPGTANANLSLFKEFPLSRLREGAHLELRTEWFNALNHPQFCGPNATLGNSNFGQVTCQANSPRQIQMALKLYF
jgi:hypothetical protein